MNSRWPSFAPATLPFFANDQPPKSPQLTFKDASTPRLAASRPAFTENLHNDTIEEDSDRVRDSCAPT
jgi:hypothetical protein